MFPVALLSEQCSPVALLSEQCSPVAAHSVSKASVASQPADVAQRTTRRQNMAQRAVPMRLIPTRAGFHSSACDWREPETAKPGRQPRFPKGGRDDRWKGFEPISQPKNALVAYPRCRQSESFNCHYFSRSRAANHTLLFVDGIGDGQTVHCPPLLAAAFRFDPLYRIRLVE